MLKVNARFTNLLALQSQISHLINSIKCAKLTLHTHVENFTWNRVFPNNFMIYFIKYIHSVTAQAKLVTLLSHFVICEGELLILFIEKSPGENNKTTIIKP